MLLPIVAILISTVVASNVHDHHVKKIQKNVDISNRVCDTSNSQRKVVE